MKKKNFSLEGMFVYLSVLQRKAKFYLLAQTQGLTVHQLAICDESNQLCLNIHLSTRNSTKSFNEHLTFISH